MSREAYSIRERHTQASGDHQEKWEKVKNIELERKREWEKERRRDRDGRKPRGTARILRVCACTVCLVDSR